MRTSRYYVPTSRVTFVVLDHVGQFRQPIRHTSCCLCYILEEKDPHRPLCGVVRPCLPLYTAVRALYLFWFQWRRKASSCLMQCSVNLANNYFHGRSVRRSNRCTPYGFLSARLFRDADALRYVRLSIIPTHTHALFSTAFHTSIGTLHNPYKERRTGLTCCAEFYQIDIYCGR